MPSIHLKAAVYAGLIAGLVFLILEMLLVSTIGGGSPWGPPRMIAAIALGEGVLPPPATFDPVIITAALVIHFILSAILGILFALVLEKADWGPGVAVLAGLLFGIIIYVVNFYGMTALFPWFAMARNAISIFAHAIFGLTLALAYRRLIPAT